jgi:hypothetical protein
MPDLSFQVETAATHPMAAEPHLVFRLRIAVVDAPEMAIPAIALRCPIQFEPTRRRYEATPSA